MSRYQPHQSHEASPSGFRVEPPRASDAIGVALRDAFEREVRLPDDMAAILRRLNGASTRNV